jgi:hypothetical protein
MTTEDPRSVAQLERYLRWMHYRVTWSVKCAWMGKCVTCDDEPTPFVLDVRLLASCSRMQLLDGRRLRYGESFHGNVVQFAVFASGGPLGYRAGHSDENRSGLRRRALV